MIIKTDRRGLAEMEMILNMSATNACSTMTSIYKESIISGVAHITSWKWPLPPEHDPALDATMEGFMVRLSGDISGNALFLFTSLGSKKMIKVIHSCENLRRASLELFMRSMLAENAHIIVTAYLNHFVSNLELQIRQGPPIYLHDNGVSLWQLAMTESLYRARRALYARTSFSDSSSNILAHLFLIPSPQCWELVEGGIPA